MTSLRILFQPINAVLHVLVFFITLRDFFGGWWEGVEEDTVSHKIRDFGNWTRFENKTMTR